MYKYNFVKNQGEKIEAIAIGHSQLYDDFKPSSFKLSAFNLSNSAQSYIDDYYILEELLPLLPNLKIVILPIGYIDADNKETCGLSDRSVYYHEYMNIDYDGMLPFKYRFECLDPKMAISKIVSYYIYNSDITRCDSLGQRNTSVLKNREKELGFERLIEGYTRDIYEGFYLTNEYYLEKIIQMLQNRKIETVLVSPPYYWKCVANPNIEQQVFVNNKASELSKQYNVQYINLEDNDEFTYDDFFDESHLSEYGAEKFTQVLNELIVIN